MPIYEYRCRDCEEEIEVTQRITDDPLQTCPKCGGALSKLISNTSFILKGTGWYATDYAKKSSPPPSEKKSTDSAAASKTSTEKSETKSKSPSSDSAKSKSND